MRPPPRISPAEQHVLDYLKATGSSAVRAIARALRVTSMAVRHHLDVLEKAGLVKRSIDRGRLGRPRYIFSLTPAADPLFPKRYDEFACRLIATISRLDGSAKMARLFKRMGKDATAQAAPRMKSKKLPGRIAEMVKIMTAAGFMAEWRQLDNRTFEITQRNCAIKSVAERCQYACETELAAMRKLLKATVRRQLFIASGDPVCSYLVRDR